MIVRVAVADEQVARDRITFAAWGGSLRLDQYLQREAELRTHPWSRRAMTTWLLADSDGVTGERVLASCESYQMASRLDGEPGSSFGIASVYTEEALRGRGYASRLVDEVAARLLDGDPRAQAVVLYSEVPPKVYERAGFVVAPRDEWFLEPRPTPAPPGLTIDDAVPASLGSTDVGFEITPAADQIDWHLARERFYADVRNRRRPARHVIRLGQSYLVFAANLKSLELLVLTHRFDADTAPALLAAAADVAWQLGLAYAKLWAPDDVPLPSFAKALPSDSSLPMIRAQRGVPVWKNLQRAAWV